MVYLPLLTIHESKLKTMLAMPDLQRHDTLTWMLRPPEDADGLMWFLDGSAFDAQWILCPSCGFAVVAIDEIVVDCHLLVDMLQNILKREKTWEEYAVTDAELAEPEHWGRTRCRGGAAGCNGAFRLERRLSFRSGGPRVCTRRASAR